MISDYHVVHCKCDILCEADPNTTNVQSALWILMPRWFSTRASVATVLIMHPCFSSCLWVKTKMTLAATCKVSVPNKYAIMCQNHAGIRPMLLASDQFLSVSGILKHLYRARITALSDNSKDICSHNNDQFQHIFTWVTEFMMIM